MREFTSTINLAKSLLFLYLSLCQKIASQFTFMILMKILIKYGIISYLQVLIKLISQSHALNLIFCY